MNIQTHRLRVQPSWLALLTALYSQNLLAETAEPKSAGTEPVEIELPTVSVTGNPLGVGSDELVMPVSVLNGRELSLKRESTLGETLNGIPGVSSTHFGPNASRPVIRGLDGERVRIMQNGVGITDASSLSFDHAVAIDPLVIEQIDVVRGPAALLYGGSAVGGVVNAIDHRIPTEKLDGIIGRTEGRIGGPDSQNNLAGVIDAGNGQIVLHADVYSRKSSDLDIPGYAVSRRKQERDGTPRTDNSKLVNSSADSDGGAIGASLTFDHGYVGASFSSFNSNYGTVADPAVRIDMQSQRWDIASEFTDLGAYIPRVKFRLAHTDYEHVELEGEEVGTTFKNRGIEGSLEAGHGKIAGFNGVVGLQFQNTRFAALGEEAFVPSTRTQAQAVYFYEELPWQDFKFSFGGRFGHSSVESEDSATFGPGQQQRFTPTSYALGGLYNINAQWSVTTNLSHNERAPSYFELFANGAHLATGQFEVGDTNLDVERSNGIDAQLRWKDAGHQISVGAYYTRFSNFIGLLNSNNRRGADGELNPVDADGNGMADGSGENIIPEAVFTPLTASFIGLEAEGKFKLDDHWQLNLRGDYVRATDRDNDDPLPRITPFRLGGGLQYQKNSFGARLDILHAFSQHRTADNELPTDSYTDLSAMLTYKLPTKLNIELFAKANNLLDDEIREHASFLKDIAPQGARALLIGFRSDF